MPPLLRGLPLLALLLAPAAWAGDCGDPADLPAPYAALVRAEQALDAGRPADALASLESARDLPPGPAERRRLLLLGRAQVEAGDFVGARKTLAEDGPRAGDSGARPSACDGDFAELLFWLGENALRHGAPAAAVPPWRALWTTRPLSPRSEQVEALLRQHDPDHSEHQRELALARARQLGALNQHRAALALLEERIEPTGDEDLGVFARALFDAKEYRRAIAVFAQLPNLGPDDRFNHALATSRLGDYDGAARLYRALLQQDPGSKKPGRVFDDASFKLGYLLYDKGRLEEGIAEFAAHLERFPASRHADEAHWFTGWSLLKLGRLDAAEQALGRLVHKHRSSSLAAGAAYWKARIAGMRGDADTERAGFEQVLSAYPESSYAWWASRRLRRTWSAPTLPAAPSSKEGLAADPGFARGLALLAAGVPDWAAAEFQALSARAKKAGREASLQLGSGLAEAGLWPEARALMRPFCGPAVKRGDLAALQLCWPRPERAQVDAATALVEHLPYAIMKAESGWNPAITSPAGARGLMQLMPKLAAAQSAELHPGAPFDPDSLYDAATNVGYGLAELSALSRSLADAAEPPLPLVIAAYNGGESSVRRWLAEQPAPLEVDRWAEDISYSETRRYVRRVLGTLQVYRTLYGDR